MQWCCGKGCNVEKSYDNCWDGVPQIRLIILSIKTSQITWVSTKIYFRIFLAIIFLLEKILHFKCNTKHFLKPCDKSIITSGIDCTKVSSWFRGCWLVYGLWRVQVSASGEKCTRSWPFVIDNSNTWFSIHVAFKTEWKLSSIWTCSDLFEILKKKWARRKSCLPAPNKRLFTNGVSFTNATFNCLIGDSVELSSAKDV